MLSASRIEKNDPNRNARRLTKQQNRGPVSESLHREAESDVLIRFAHVCADHTNLTRWLPVEVDACFGKTSTIPDKKFKEILKKQEGADFRLCRTPLYDAAGTVRANLRRDEPSV